MTLKGAVQTGDAIVARFDAAAVNGGGATVRVEFADDSGESGPPGGGVARPGASCVTAPPVAAATAGSVKVAFTLPSGGSGMLTVLVNGMVRDAGSVRQSGDWEYVVM